MIYCFDADVAKEYSVDEAIMITNFQFWIAKNKANGKYFYDGRYWTYGSSQAFVELFPFWNRRHIELILSKLIEKGVIIKGNYNQNTYDRTLWYAFVDESKWIYKKQEIHLQENVNGFTEKCKSYIDNITDNITDNNIIINNNIHTYNTTNREKKCFGEFHNVKLTDEEFEKLKVLYGDKLDIAIEVLDDYLAKKEKKYKSHYAVMKKNGWVYVKVKELEEKEIKESVKRW